MSWTEKQILEAPDKANGDDFGCSAALNAAGDICIIGAQDEYTHQNKGGAAYVFTQAVPNWLMRKKIVRPAQILNEKFGASVAMDAAGGSVAIGAPNDGFQVGQEGAVEVWTGSGGTWTLQQRLQASDKQEKDRFGLSVGLSDDGDTLIIGAPEEDTGGSGAGAAYVFTRTAGVWTEQQKIQASDKAAGANFGWSVALSSDGDTAIVGARYANNGATQAGAAYVFTRSAGVWSQQQQLQASDFQNFDFFGWSVALGDTGDTAIVGAKSEDTGGNAAGAAYIFTRSAGVWTEQQKIQASDASATASFGFSAALRSDGNTALVGANSDDTPIANAGAAYVFTRSAGVWTQSQKLQASDAGSSDNFGQSVAISGSGPYAIVGAGNAGAGIEGRAYLYSSVVQGAPFLPLEQESYARTGAPSLLLQQFSVNRGTPSLPLQQTSHLPQGAPSLPLQQISFARGTPSLPLRQASIALLPGTGAVGETTSSLWRLVVLLNGIDISASLTEDWRIEAEEGVARVAEFVMVPALGAIDPTSWVRQPVTIDYADVDAAGLVRWQARLFTGIVDVPEYDPATRLTLFRCTDKLQEVFEQSDAAAVDSQIGGYWSSHVFDPEADGWQRAQDRLSTIPASFDINSRGATHLTNWAAKATADYTFAAAGYIDGSRRLALANSRDMHNRVLIRTDFRFQRLRQRNVRRHWRMSPPIGCTFLKDPFTLPRKDMIRAAAEATGWAIQSLHLVDLPPPKGFLCQGLGPALNKWIVWGFKTVGNLSVPNPSAAEPFCQGFNLVLAKRWAQTITEAYTIDVRAPQSITQLGEIAREDYGSVEAEQETDGWETDIEYTEPAVGAAVHRNGDHVVDADQGVDDGRTAAENQIRTKQAIARTGILASHRRNTLSWRTLIQPQLELIFTIKLDTDIVAKGKAVGLIHAGSIDTGEATTEIRLALSRSGAVGAQGDDPLDPPPAPDSQVDTVPDPTPSYSGGNSGMHIGGHTDSPTFDESWTGFVTNYLWDSTLERPFATDPDLPQTVIYPVQFRIQMPEIEQGARQAVQAQQVQRLNVDIPLDDLTIS